MIMHAGSLGSRTFLGTVGMHDDACSARVSQKIGLQFRGKRKLRVFGGAHSAVYAWPEMSQDLTVYGIDD